MDDLLNGNLLDNSVKQLNQAVKRHKKRVLKNKFHGAGGENTEQPVVSPAPNPVVIGGGTAQAAPSPIKQNAEVNPTPAPAPQIVAPAGTGQAAPPPNQTPFQAPNTPPTGGAIVAPAGTGQAAPPPNQTPYQAPNGPPAGGGVLAGPIIYAAPPTYYSPTIPPTVVIDPVTNAPVAPAATSMGGGFGGGGGGSTAGEQAAQGASITGKIKPTHYWVYGLIAGVIGGYFWAKRKNTSISKTIAILASIGAGSGFVVDKNVAKKRQAILDAQLAQAAAAAQQQQQGGYAGGYSGE